MEHDRDLTIEAIFEEGDYAVYLEVEWCQNFVKELVISSYGEFNVSFFETETNDVTNGQILDGLLKINEAVT